MPVNDNVVYSVVDFDCTPSTMVLSISELQPKYRIPLG